MTLEIKVVQIIRCARPDEPTIATIGNNRIKCNSFRPSKSLVPMDEFNIPMIVERGSGKINYATCSNGTCRHFNYFAIGRNSRVKK